MPDSNAHLDREAKVDLDRGPNVGITCYSGRRDFQFTCLRSGWRRFLETELRRLNDFEATERDRVVPLRRAKVEASAAE